MDQAARVTLLEEEVSLLKGEIKSILQELRTAVLARENPFNVASLEVPAASAAGAAAGNGTPNLAAAMQHVAETASGQPGETAPSPRAGGTLVLLNGGAAAKQASPVDGAIAAGESASRRWSVHSLAALMSWTQDAVQRFSIHDLGIVLSLARYGGLVEAELESTLLKLARGSVLPDRQPRATGNDFLLALRQLDALLDDAESGQFEAPARRAG
jgi:hypothetical protein